MDQPPHDRDENVDAFQDPWGVIGDQHRVAARVHQMRRHVIVHFEQQMPWFGGRYHSGRGRRTTFFRCCYLLTFLLATIYIATMLELAGIYRHLLSDLGADNKISQDDVALLSKFSTLLPETTLEDWGDGNGRWDRFLVGIFSYDSPNEYDLRMANRETHLSYFERAAFDDHRKKRTICSLQELLNNASLANDWIRCRIVYTFVMGGGIRDDNLRNKYGRGLNLDSVSEEIKTRCLWQDPGCGGEDIRQWTLKNPKFEASLQLQEEIKKNQDITFLSISENHELGKTDTWFTFAAMLTKSRSNLNIRFIAKMDSDNFLNYTAFLAYFKRLKQYIKERRYLYGGYVIYKEVCSGRAYGHLCKQPEFIAPLFIGGALAYLSTPLAQHVYTDGTTLEQKKQVWISREDVQLGNMAFSDPSIKVELLNHHHNGGTKINTHCFSDPVRYRHEYSITMGNTTFVESEGAHNADVFD